jgi:polysaccharide biosynthesis protein PslA
MPRPPSNIASNMAAPSQQQTRATGPTSKARGRISLHGCAAALMVAECLAFGLAGIAVAPLGAREFRGSVLNVEDWQAQVIVFAACSHLVWARLFGVYRTKSILRPRHALQRLPLSILTTFMVLLVIVVALKSAEIYSRLWAFSWASLTFALIAATRLAFFNFVSRAMENGACVERALSVGMFGDPIAENEIERHTRNEVRVIERVRLSNLADIASLADWITRDEIDQIYLATPWEHVPTVLQELHLLHHLSARVYVLPSTPSLGPLIAKVSTLGGRPSFCVIEEPIPGWSLWFKRIEDLVVAASALLVLSPLLVLVAVAIRLDSRGPIFFRQFRTGFNGRTFELWKFRSMYADMTDHHAETQTSRHDPRVTNVGRIIRRTSIDELPQLINVIQGTMSLIGPRPHALATKAEGRELNELVDYYAVRHRVKPGLTGWAQIHGLRGELDSIEKLQKRVDYDIEYIDRWSIWLDIMIIFKTILLLFHDSSAY